MALAQEHRPAALDFDKLSAQAEQASEQNRLGEAIGLYRKALVIQPKWVEGWWSLGTLLYDRNEYANAAFAFQKVVLLDTKDGTAYAMLGLCQFELGRDAIALKDLQTGRQLGLANDPQLRNVMLYHEGILLLRNGQFGSAQDTLVRLSRDGVQNENLFLALGMSVLLLRPGALPEKATPERDVVLQAGQAEAQASMKQFEQAKQVYIAIVKEYPDYPNLHYAYGRFLLEMHDTDEAVRQFKRELKNNPDQVNAMLEIAAVRYRIDSASGLRYAEEAVKLAPQLPFAHYLLGLLYLDTNQAAVAIPHLEAARRAFPNEPSVYFALGTAYAKVGRKEDAARARLIFLRLNQEAGEQEGATVYGGQTLSPSQQKLRVGRTDSHPN